MDTLLIKRVLVSLFFIFSTKVLFAAPQGDAQLITAIKDKLLKQTKVSGTFSQTKYIKQMDVTLDSSGKFALDSKAGLLWQQLTPFAYTLKLGAERIEAQSENGSLEVISREQNPMIFAFSQTFLSLFSGDLTQLKGKFDYQATGKIENWSIALTPVAEMVKKAIRQILVTGAKTVTSIKIDDAQGNNMNIRLAPIDLGQ